MGATRPRTGSSRLDRRRLRLLLLTTLAAAAVVPPVAAQTLGRESEIVFQVPSEPSLRLDAGTVEILENGARREVHAVDRVTDRWRLVVYFDLPASTSEGTEAAATLLAAAADRLVTLGDVEVIVSDRIAEVVQEPTADADAVRQAAAAVAGRAHEAGRVLSLRRNLKAAAETRSGDPDADGLRTADLLEGFLQELDTLARQRANLLESLRESPRTASPSAAWARGPPKALLLVRDGMDLSADAFAQELLGEPIPAFERAASSEKRRQRSLARTVAALGWRVYPLHAVTPAAEIEELLPGRRLHSEDFARASGGQLLNTAEELAAATVQLGESWRVRYDSAGPRDGTTHPVDVRVAASGGGPPPVLAARRWATVAAPTDLVGLRANRALETMTQGGDYEDAGHEALGLRAVLLPQGIASTADGAPAELVTLDGLVTVREGAPAASDDLRITIYGRGLDAPPLLIHRSGSGAGLDRGAWRFRTLFDLPTAIDELVLMVEDLRNDRWRVTFLEPAANPLDQRSDVELLTPNGASAGASAELAEAAILAEARSAARRAGWNEPVERAGRGTAGRPGSAGLQGNTGLQGSWVRLVPPRGERSGLSGKKSFSTVTTSEIVRRVEFYLDDELVFDDKRKPFTTRIDLGPEAVPHVVRIIGYDRSDRRLGEDELPINQPRRNTEIEIASIEAREGGSYAVEARVELVRGRRLDRVEFYRNDRLAATLTRPPFRTVLPGPAMPGADFARLAVYFDDGSMIEDVEFLSSDAAVAETIVNLVEVYVVVTDEEGKPVTTLSREDFVLRGGRQPIPIDRFAVAEDVPLVLGLAVDSSRSMWALMPDVRTAAARFLGNTLTRIDQAFLVDFDSRPRLISDTTTDVKDLIASLNDMRADGQTALYDAMQFSLVHLARDQGRRALVVLTDGDDFGSQSSYRRTFRTARNSGVPIYVINMAQGDSPLARGPRKLDVEAITKASGGRIYYVASMDAVLWAYEHIGTELRSQYMLGYSTSAPLTSREVQSIKVELKTKRPDYEVRLAVGRGRG